MPDRLTNFLGRLWPWLAETWLATSTAMLLGAGMGLAWGRYCEPAFRYSSGILQAVGVATVVLDISSKRRAAGHDPMVKRLKDWWERRPRWRQEVSENLISGAAAADSSASGFGTAEMSPYATLDQRVAYLEQAQKALRNDLVAFQAATNTSLKQVNNRLSEEAAARKRQDRLNAEMFKEGLAGGLDLSAAGSLSLALGLLLATLANEYDEACRMW